MLPTNPGIPLSLLRVSFKVTRSLVMFVSSPAHASDPWIDTCLPAACGPVLIKGRGVGRKWMVWDEPSETRRCLGTASEAVSPLSSSSR